MEKIRKDSEEWEVSPSGILIRARNIADISSYSKMSYLDARQKAEKIEELYSRYKLVIPKESYLAHIIDNAKNVWGKYVLSELEMKAAFDFVHFDRVASAIIPLSDEPDPSAYLKRLLRGTLDFFERKESEAKNILWELEVWSKLKRAMSNAYLQEPDILLDFDTSKIGIACKKIYSINNVENTLSKAVFQTKSSGELGIISMSIDELTPKDSILRAKNFEEMTHQLLHQNNKFISNNERYFQKYLSQGRIIGVLVSTTVIAAIDEATTRINHASQWNIWTMPDISEECDRLAKHVYHLVVG